MKYVIIGNSAAGVSCAETIREYDKEGTVTIVSEEKFPAYSRPLISYYLKDKVTEEVMHLRDSSHFDKLGIDVITGTRAVDVDTVAKTVLLDNSDKLYYDKLMLATGSVPFVPPVEGTDGKKNIYTFLNIAS